MFFGKNVNELEAKLNKLFDEKGLTDRIWLKIEKMDYEEQSLVIEKGEIDLLNFIDLRADNQIEFSVKEKREKLDLELKSLKEVKGNLKMS